MKKWILLAMMFFVSAAYSWTLKTGTYDLSGGNSNWSGSAYQGEVIIAPQGDTYSVVWKIGTRQAHVGIGILQDDIFSVAFIDLDNNRFWGVASYRVKAFGELEGKWVSYDGKVSKPEYLVWKNHLTY